jgi:hypothetical protein
MVAADENKAERTHPYPCVLPHEAQWFGTHLERNRRRTIKYEVHKLSQFEARTEAFIRSANP